MLLDVLLLIYPHAGILGVFRAFEGLFSCLLLQSLCALCNAYNNRACLLCMCLFSIRQRRVLRIDTIIPPMGEQGGAAAAAG